MKLIQYINGILKDCVAATPELVLYGQNITLGSCLGGLCRGLTPPLSGLVINSPNSENTLVGLGFGAMLGGVSSVFFVKQLDFLYLGLDHFVHTYNYVRRLEPKASFTIIPTVVDNGYQGLQSSANNSADFCSMARIEAFNICNRHDADVLIREQLVRPGFRMLCVSARMCGQEAAEWRGLVEPTRDRSIFKYAEGSAATIVCFNFALEHGMAIHRGLAERGLQASLFNVNAAHAVSWAPVIEDVRRTRRLVLLDDTKSANSTSDGFLVEVLDSVRLATKVVLRRDLRGVEWLKPHQDLMKVDADGIVAGLREEVAIGGIAESAV